MCGWEVDGPANLVNGPASPIKKLRRPKAKTDGPLVLQTVKIESKRGHKTYTFSRNELDAALDRLYNDEHRRVLAINTSMTVVNSFDVITYKEIE